ncbi:hypothetical protein D187_001339 [Cystobacter fuscus DSM 2262]|uniref:Uncharacterized protein n=1 Tax=Cystobacter fuscus (strain ATCC 25194 / DSM 2262 / NBRC 100088 / M29) TaxID=1242864 RepID=S9P8D8_CYSF2|nr:hypothetical protein D187_001339 [Cystobacter fuscus DSM 2262]
MTPVTSHEPHPLSQALDFMRGDHLPPFGMGDAEWHIRALYGEQV